MIDGKRVVRMVRITADVGNRSQVFGIFKAGARHERRGWLRKQHTIDEHVVLIDPSEWTAFSRFFNIP